MIEVFALRNSASDEQLEVIRLLVKDGAQVREGAPIISLEGAKSIFDIEAPDNGIIKFSCLPGELVQVGDIIAYILSAQEPLAEDWKSPNGAKPTKRNQVERVYTGGAKSLIKEFNISDDSFGDETFVTEALVKQALRNRTKGDNFEDSQEPRQIGFLESGRVAFLGAGRGAEVANEILRKNDNYELSGVFDSIQNSLESAGASFLGELRREEIEAVWKSGGFDGALITISSDIDLRETLFEVCSELEIPLATLIHERSFVDPSSQIGPGSIILDSARVGAFATVQANVFLSAFVNIEHHCSVGQNSTFGPGVFLSGAVSVGRNCVFGTSIGVEPNLTIGEKAVIASGQIVTSSVGPGTVLKYRV